MIHFYGEPMFREGLKTYFQKYSFKNTQLKDFIAEMAASATKHGLTETDLTSWADEWLQTAGCSKISLQIETDSKGTVTAASITQESYNLQNTPANKLRTQKFQLACLDDNMQVVREYACETSSTQAVTAVAGLVGT